MKRASLWLVAILLATTSITAGWQSAHSQPLVPLRVGVMQIGPNVPFFTALDKGFFAEEGLKVEFTPMAGGAVIIPAIMGGSLDIGFSAIFTILLAQAQGIDFRVIASNNYQNSTGRPDPDFGYGGDQAVMVAPGSEIRAAKQLEGKKLAIGALKSIDWMIISLWLEKKGADPKRVHWVEIPFPNMGPALVAGQVDAIQGVEPFVTLLKAKSEARVVDYPYWGIKPNVIIAVYGTGTKFLKERPELVAKFARAHNRAIEYINARPGEIPLIMNKYLRIPLDIAGKITPPLWKTEVELEGIDWTAEMAMKFKLVDKKIEAAKIVHETALRK